MITTNTRDGIQVVVLDRPERRNALVPELAERLVEALRSAGEAGRPVVLTATGTTFCPGADLKWMAAEPDAAVAVAELVAVHHLAVVTLLEMPVPVIAAVTGAVAGGGLGLALACDYRVAAERATFTAAYFRLGLTPDGGSSAFLQQMIGRAKTLELLLTNKTLSAVEARDWGLVNEVVADDRALEAAVAFARSLHATPGYALRQTRGLLDAINIRNQLQLEAVAIRTAARGAWFRDAVAAFAAAHPD
ncbi:MAG TPA: enoyl-CoA hydratase/isomerase family protein [Chloroflexota bacterium]|nr:enoyl-CoA hydratase/isomerase family protein [Chloroflexota bacterium]